MRAILIASASALILAACATATPYAPAPEGGMGYAETRIESNRYRVTFSGNSLTDRETVETFLLYRAAELTLQEGYDWFVTASRETDADTRYVATPDPLSPRFSPYWDPWWRFYRGGYWSPLDRWGRDYDVRESTRYEAMAEIVMGRGTKPADDPAAFDAREVVANLGPRVRRPVG